MSSEKQNTPEFGKAFKAILQQDQKVVKVKTIFQDAMTMLDERKISYPLKKMPVNNMFVHPKNRSGLGLSWHNVHRNGK